MKKISCQIFFYNSPAIEISSIEPFKQVDIKLLRQKANNMLQKEYQIDDNGTVRKINQNNPRDFIENLHKAIYGSYWHAAKAKIISI